MPKKEPPPQPSRTHGWKNIVELSPETEELLDQVMVTNNFNSSTDEVFQNALRHYLDDQCGVELNPELAASLDRALKSTNEGGRVSAQESRRRIHEWVVQSSLQRLQ